MATKKSKKKVTKKAKVKATKGSSAGPSKKIAPRRPKKRSPTRKRLASKTSPAKAIPKKKPKGAKRRTPSVMAGTKARGAIRREDRPGHLDPHYAAGLRAQSGRHERGPQAFIERARSGSDDLAEELGEAVVEKATTGEDEAEDVLDQIVPEEQGGPFVETSAAQEFAHGTDASNPKGAKREPFPTT